MGASRSSFLRMNEHLRTNLVVLIALASRATFLALVTWPRPPPVSGTGTASVRSGTGYTCSTTTAGDASCGGDNGFGQLGNGTMQNSSTPTNAAALSSGVAGLDVGGIHGCA